VKNEGRRVRSLIEKVKI